MRRTLLIAILCGASTFCFSQSPAQTDEMTSLKKQVTTLKQTNSKLDQSIKELKKNSKDMQANLDAKLMEYDKKISIMGDSLKAKEATIAKMDNRESQIFHSLQLRKTAFIVIFVIAIVLLIAIYLLITKNIKTAGKKTEAKIYNVKDALEADANKTKADFQSQIASIKAEIATTKDDLEKKIKDSKK